MEFEVKRLTKRCATTDQELRAGEVYFSALVQQGAEVVRQDFCSEAWQGPPTGTIGWWTGTVPSLETTRTHWAPQDVMLHLFEELADQPDQADLRYLLTLLMIRRRILRVQNTENVGGSEFLIVHSAKLDQDIRVQVITPSPARKQVIHEYLQRLILERVA
ncbi:MAG: hypothetical protein O2931_03710 [Planctomycetota bacterium]|nr:hypothetical protein [Planctomycetota bacterium]MDA1177884.1 hypothetical protein [Planctomycetota bacterium]